MKGFGKKAAGPAVFPKGHKISKHGTCIGRTPKGRKIYCHPAEAAAPAKRKGGFGKFGALGAFS